MAIGITHRKSTPPPTWITYDVTFFDDTVSTTVTNRPEVVDEWIGVIMSRYHNRPRKLMMFGLDVECLPATAHVPSRVAVLQLCVADLCLVYQIYRSEFIPDRLINLLSHNNFATFVGVGIQSQLEKLQADFAFGREAKHVDLREFAAEMYDQEELKVAMLPELAKFVLGEEVVEKPFGVRMSRWHDRQLTEEQVQFACVDALMCHKIGKMLGITLDC